MLEELTVYLTLSSNLAGIATRTLLPLSIYRIHLYIIYLNIQIAKHIAMVIRLNVNIVNNYMNYLSSFWITFSSSEDLPHTLIYIKMCILCVVNLYVYFSLMTAVLIWTICFSTLCVNILYNYSLDYYLKITYTFYIIAD